MKAKWLGHACSLISSRSGLRVITDPYAVGGGIDYCPISESADFVVVSHEHGDRNNVLAVQGKPEIVKGSGEKDVKSIQFTGVAAFRDASQDQYRGPNAVFCLAMDDMKLCHLGDLGQLLSPGQVSEIGAVDVLFVPVGGFFTIDASVTSQVCDQLRPKIVVPMHFETLKCNNPLIGVKDFLKGKKDVRKAVGSEVEFERGKLPAATEIVLFQSAS
jgi:L-ascorbate metabolism protein UlaG (beta-lactamase superfamily)